MWTVDILNWEVGYRCARPLGSAPSSLKVAGNGAVSFWQSGRETMVGVD